MYAALWRRLPGPRWLKVAQAVVLAALVIVVLMTLVFPAVESWLNLDAPSIN